MRQSLWSLGVLGLVIGTLGMVGGTAVGGTIGPLAAAYGLLLTTAALWLVAGLAIRERVAKRRAATLRLPDATRLAGRRVF
jgi:4-hydroxybenzoate polyprenyltransferase